MEITKTLKVSPEELAAMGLKPEDLSVSPYDVNDYLNSPAEVAGYLNTALAMGGLPLLLKGLGDVARRPDVATAGSGGLSRENLTKALTPDANPSLDTVLRLSQALGLQLHFVPLAPGEEGEEERK